MAMHRLAGAFLAIGLVVDAQYSVRMHSMSTLFLPDFNDVSGSGKARCRLVHISSLCIVLCIPVLALER
jgi:hypothetical protein